MKKRSILIILMGIFLSACQVNDTPLIPDVTQTKTLESNQLTSDFVVWFGRHTYLNEQVYYYHTATGFKVEFYGRLIEIEMKLENKQNDIYYSISKNGEDILEGDVFVQSDALENIIIEFDSFDHHTLEVIKRSEPEDGVTSIQRITTNGYFKTVTTDDDHPHFLIMGASGISGHGALGQQGQPRTTENSSSLHAFGYLSARAFNGSVEFVSSSGWGLRFGFNDLSGQDNIARAYDYVGIDPSREIINIEHDHGINVPDYIIINLGGNDYNAVINKLTGFARTEAILEFKEAVAAFILELRKNAPEAHIIWTMTSGSQNGSAAKEVILLLDDIDQAFVHVVVIQQVGQGGDPIGANQHASYETHQKSAQNIIDLINQIKNK